MTTSGEGACVCSEVGSSTDVCSEVGSSTDVCISRAMSSASSYHASPCVYRSSAIAGERTLSRQRSAGRTHARVALREGLRAADAPNTITTSPRSSSSSPACAAVGCVASEGDHACIRTARGRVRRNTRVHAPPSLRRTRRRKRWWSLHPASPHTRQQEGEGAAEQRYPHGLEVGHGAGGSTHSTDFGAAPTLCASSASTTPRRRGEPDGARGSARGGGAGTGGICRAHQWPREGARRAPASIRRRATGWTLPSSRRPRRTCNRTGHRLKNPRLRAAPARAEPPPSSSGAC